MVGYDLAEAIVARPLKPFERLSTPPDFLRSADRIIKKGWSLGRSSKPIFLDRPDDRWRVQGRSHAFHLQAWDPIDPLLAAYSETAEMRLLEAAMPFAVDWLYRFQEPVLGSSARVELADGNDMAWYDMAVGQRVHRMAYFLDAAARLGLLSSEAVELMSSSILFHLELLAIEEFFKSHNNHGLYQALGQLASARRLAFDTRFSAYEAQASRRVTLMVQNSFFRSGAHTEHSPGYHHMILGTFRGALNAGLIDVPEARKTIADAIEVEHWMTKPDGRLVSFGDTDPVVVHHSPVDLQGVLHLEDAGYVFARKGSSYFALAGGFHSRVHKHADHLSFVWQEDGVDILSDPGRYGYGANTPQDSELRRQGFYYSSKERIYVERTRAHNCVEIDGLDYERKAANAPFGSAIRFCADQLNHVVVLSELRHRSRIRHFRLLLWKASEHLVVIDWLRSGGVDEPHNFRQWFQFGLGWNATTSENGLVASHRKTPLTVRADALVGEPEMSKIYIGEQEPEMQGWVSDGPESLVPSPSFNWSFQGSGRAVFATVFTSGQALQVLPSFVNAAMTKGELSWSDDRGPHTIFFTRETATNVVNIR